MAASSKGSSKAKKVKSKLPSISTPALAVADKIGGTPGMAAMGAMGGTPAIAAMGRGASSKNGKEKQNSYQKWLEKSNAPAYLKDPSVAEDVFNKSWSADAGDKYTDVLFSKAKDMVGQEMFSRGLAPG